MQSDNSFWSFFASNYTSSCFNTQYTKMSFQLSVYRENASNQGECLSNVMYA